MAQPYTPSERAQVLDMFARLGHLGGERLERYEATVCELEGQLARMVTKEYLAVIAYELGNMIVKHEDEIADLKRRDSVREAELQALRQQVLGIAVDVCDKLSEMEEAPLYRTQQIALRLLALTPASDDETDSTPTSGA